MAIDYEAGSKPVDSIQMWPADDSPYGEDRLKRLLSMAVYRGFMLSGMFHNFDEAYNGHSNEMMQDEDMKGRVNEIVQNLFQTR